MANNQSSGGMSLFGVLTVVFIVLKLIGTITWSWWWVLAPTWIPLVVVVLFFTAAIIIAKN